MKNRIKNQSKAATQDTGAGTVRLQVTLRIREERWKEFEQLARNLAISHDQLASAMIDGDMEGEVITPSPFLS